MSPASVERSAARLREAGAALRARSRAEVLSDVGRVLDAWREPDSPWQRALVPRLAAAAGFSKANVARGLALALEDWSSDALQALHARELASAGDDGAEGFGLTSVVLAGSIPMPTILQLLLPLCVQSPVLAKPASRDPVTAALLRDSLGELAPELAPCLEIAEFGHDDEAAWQALLAAACVVASGSDATVAALRERAKGAPHFVAYGHKLSVAAVGSGGCDDATAQALSLDIALWDQLGCLSPISIYTVATSARERTDFAAALAAALAQREVELPRGAIEPGVAARIRQERDEARFRLAARLANRQGALHASAGSEWTVSLESDAALRPAPLHRFVRIHPVEDLDALARALAPLRPHLSIAAANGFADSAALADCLGAAGASRVCAPGQMQAPPLDWPHDGAPVLRPLTVRAARDAGWARLDESRGGG